MIYSKEELLEAKRQIDSTLHKLREVVSTLEGKENSRPLSIPDHPGQAPHPGFHHRHVLD
ncbi:MAG: hypothetical protein V8R40_14170 [Dysosmobacter sp.]